MNRDCLMWYFMFFSALDILILGWGIGIPIKRLTRRYAVAIKWRYGNTWVDLALICTSLYNETLRGWRMYVIVYVAVLMLYFVMNGLLTSKPKKVNLAEVLKNRE